MVVWIICSALLILIALIAISIIVFKGKSNTDKISFKESMELVELPIITFYNNNVKLNFLLDTGSNFSYINSSVLSKLEYNKLEKTKSIIGMEGNMVPASTCTMTVSYRDMIFTDEYNILDLDKSFGQIKQDSGVLVHGILGNRFFEKYKYILDFKDLTAYIKK